MIIDADMVDIAEEEGACEEALDWLREAPRTIEELVRDQPGFACWALGIPGFPDLLTDEQFAECAELSPGDALTYAGNRVTGALLDKCAYAAPGKAIRHVVDRLSDEQFARAAIRAPEPALRFASHRVSDALFDVMVKAHPASVLRLAPHRLTPEQLKYCETH